MARIAIVAVAIALAGGAAAPPVLARDRDLPCPDVPPPADVARSSSGTASLQVAGIAVGGGRERNNSATDVFARLGGFEAWSAAVALAHACAANRQAYPNDPARQSEALLALRERLLRSGREGLTSTQFNGRTTSSNSAPSSRPQPVMAPTRSDPDKPNTFYFNVADLWQPMSSAAFFPEATQRASLMRVGADLDCRIAPNVGASDCRLLTESEPGAGAAAKSYLYALRLRDELISGSWTGRRVTYRVRLSRNGEVNLQGLTS